MDTTPDPRPNPDDPSLDPNRPLEPRVPMNAEHATPITSLLILAGFVAVVIIGGWMVSGERRTGGRRQSGNAAGGAVDNRRRPGALRALIV